VVQNNSFPFDKRISKEAYSLIKNGFNVHVISPISRHDNKKRENVDEIDVYRYKNFLSNGSTLGFTFEYLNSIVRIFALSLYLIFNKKINIIHVANPPDFFWPLALICKVFKIKFIYDQHDIAPEMYKLKFKNKFIYKILLLNEKLSVRIADAVIVVNNSFNERLKKLWGLESGKCLVVTNGPLKSFEPKENPALRKKYDGKKNILYVGLMTINDNIEVIIQTANRLINDLGRKECFFILLGDGDVRKKMEEMATNYHLNNYVEFTGIVSYEKVMEYLAIADVCIAPDQPNGLNEYLTLIKVLEYMKAKRPFVSFDLKETRDLTKGLGLYADNLDDFVQKILKIIDDPQLAAKLGEEGKTIIENEYLWEHSEMKLLSLYKKLLS
jgi:glycosyltransferase involved in cell wall biosynthesis